MPLKAVLFDHDGTLVDSEGVHWQLWQEVLKPYAIDLSESHDFSQAVRIFSNLADAGAWISQAYVFGQ